MDRFATLQAFVKVAEAKGFAPAARALGLSPSAVTRLVAALEDKGYRTIFLVMAVAIVAPLVFLYPISEKKKELEGLMVAGEAYKGHLF